MDNAKTSRFGRKAMSLFLSGAMVVAFAPAVAAPLAEAEFVNGDTVSSAASLILNFSKEACFIWNTIIYLLFLLILH